MIAISRRQALQTAAAGLAASLARPAPSQASAGIAEMAGMVYTANEQGNSISAIALTDGTVETVALPISAHNVQITNDNARLLAVGVAAEAHGHTNEVSGLLLVMDPDRLQAGPARKIELGRHPAHVVLDATDRLALITLSDEDVVVVVDLTAGVVTGRIPTGAYPHGLRLHPNGTELWVANVKDGTLSVLDLGGARETARIAVGAAPVQVGFVPSGRRLFASLRDENAVAVVDTGARRLIGKIPVRRGPIQVHASPDGRWLYVANQGSEADPDRCLCILDVERLQVAAQVPVGLGAHGVTVSPDGTVFVSNIVEGTVSAVDPVGQRVMRTFRVGAGPNGITFRPQTGPKS
jgi:YVTN family beta-propeller protein